MQNEKTVCGGLALLLFVTAHAAVAAPPTDDADVVTSDRTMILDRESADDPILELVEVDGATAVLRLAWIDSTGSQVGLGKIIDVPPLATRTVRLRDELPIDSLSDARLRIEVLRGTGRAKVTATNQKGRRLQTRAEADSRRRRAVAPGKTTPTSEALIDKAEASGQLDSETALLYRVYAIFGDGRLPAAYRGDDSNVRDSLYMVEVRTRFPSLSPATQVLVQPFLIPPAYAGSWAEPIGPSGSANLPPPCQSTNKDSWHFVDANNFARVWYRATNEKDSQTASTLAQEINTVIWPEITKVLNDTLPHSDIDEKCNGGDGRLDIYIADVGTPIALPFERLFGTACQNAPVFINFRPGDDRAQLAHEIFHAFEMSYPLKDCIGSPDYYWWAEASAEWAMDLTYPNDKPAEQKSAPELLLFPEKSLDLNEKPHMYGAYLLPFYVSRKTGSADFVRVAWNLSKDRPALEALNEALAGSGKLKDVWPEFVLRNWNQVPVDDYKKGDGLAQEVVRDELEVKLNNAQPDASLALNYKLPPLTAKYFHFKFDNSTSTVAFWNGAKFNLSLKQQEVFGKAYLPDAAPEEKTKGIFVRALIKTEFADWKIEPWTDKPFVTYCRDMRDERLKELILIFSNSEFENRRELTPPGLAPVLWVSNMGCYQWEGNANHTNASTGEKITTQVTWTRSVPSQTVPVILYEPKGMENWSFSGTCSGSGSLSIFEIPGAPVSTLATYNFIPAEGSHYRSYVGSGGESRSVDVTCAGVPIPMSLNDWFRTPDQPIFPGIPDARFVQIDATGKIMDGSYKPNMTDDVWTWHLVAKQQ